MTIRNVLRFLGIDLAVAFVILSRGWGVLAGLVNIILISNFLTLAEQGYYYTFSSVVALQIFFELGLSVVISQFASHEMAGLTWDKSLGLTGSEINRDRIYSLVRFSTKWYGVIAPALVVVVAPIGFYFFSSAATQGVSAPDWHSPWILLVLFSALNLSLSPLVCIAEGIGLVADVARMRLVQAITGSLLLWGALANGLGLLSIAIMPAAIFVVTLYWLTKNLKPLVQAAFNSTTEAHSISWQREIFPMQWRIALSWLCGYLIFQLFTPIAFKSEGPATAGRLGMSIAITTAMLTVAMSWIVTKMPLFGRLIADHDIATMDRIFKRAVVQSTGILLVSAVVLISSVAILPYFSEELSGRILSPTDFAILSIVSIANHLIYCEASFVRSFKTEKYLPHAITIALAIILVCVPLGSHVSVTAMLAGYAGIMVFFGLPYSHYIFLNFRKALVR